MHGARPEDGSGPDGGLGLRAERVGSTPQEEFHVLARPAFCNRAHNPYNARIYEQISAFGIRVQEYSTWRALLFPAPSIVHVHWPESSFNHALAGALLTTETLLGVLRRLRARGARVVWTLHNVRAHERRHPQAEARFWERYRPLVDGVIALSSGSLERGRAVHPELCDVPGFIVRHPHYRGEYPDEVSREDARRRLGMPLQGPVITHFGRIMLYKNVPGLIRAVRASPDLALVVAGQPRDASLAEEVRAAAGDDPRVRLHLRHIPADEAQLYFRAADLVALPYKDIVNSGSALLALSFDRPVLLPPGQLAEDLASQFGASWVRAAPLSPEALAGALEASRDLPERTDGAHLKALDPSAIAEDTARVYRAVCLS